MKTFLQFQQGIQSIPMAASWHLSDLGEARGKQELFTRQSPQKLKVLREHALIESAVSSNRIEGVEIDHKRIGTVLFGKSLLHNRDEEEIRGYRNALQFIHNQGARLRLDSDLVCRLHALTRGLAGDAGQFKTRESHIIEKYPDGRQRVRFQTVSVSETPQAVIELIALWHQCLEERWVHPLIAMAAFNLDFLCIHPFRDGNGRVSRLLFLLQCYQLGYEVGRYISLERIIEQNKERYYETLEASSQRWHQGHHDPWPVIHFFLFVLKTAYQEFEHRFEQASAPKGSKTELIEAAIRSGSDTFTMTDLERAAPGVSRDMIRAVLKRLKDDGQVMCLGRGPGARWSVISQKQPKE
ncbi:MAG: Fic family protein [Acidobacteria bacterium]|nr:Fic family protein [Acidobacteriota bacterium]